MKSRLTGKVVLDAMGSDHAPHAEIDGALAAARDLGLTVILVGQPEKLVPELSRCGWRGDGDRGIELVEAAEVIGMGEPVATSVRRKKKSSLRVGSRLVTKAMLTVLFPPATPARRWPRPKWSLACCRESIGPLWPH